MNKIWVEYEKAFNELCGVVSEDNHIATRQSFSQAGIDYMTQPELAETQRPRRRRS